MGFEGIASLIFGVGLLLIAILVFVFDFFSKKKELKDHIWRANLFRKQEKYQEAIKAYLEALALDGDLCANPLGDSPHVGPLGRAHVLGGDR